MANTTCEIIWLQSLLSELDIFLTNPPILWCDNLRATYLSVNPVLHARTKHVELNYHFVRERVAAKTFHVSFVSSKDQVADIFTKPLSNARFLQLQSSLTLQSVSLGSQGAIKEQLVPTLESNNKTTKVQTAPTPTTDSKYRHTNSGQNVHKYSVGILEYSWTGVIYSL